MISDYFVDCDGVLLKKEQEHFYSVYFVVVGCYNEFVFLHKRL
jgi:hypothetical protein